MLKIALNTVTLVLIGFSLAGLLRLHPVEAAILVGPLPWTSTLARLCYGLSSPFVYCLFSCIFLISFPTALKSDDVGG